MPPVETMILAFAGGLFPALLWLWFFLREDKLQPEPRLLIFLAFFSGMVATIAALFVEKWIAQFFEGDILIFLWAAVEEILKYLAVALTVLWQPFDDEPLDPVIYMITCALGFAALETTLFLLTPLLDGNLSGTILTGNLRFLGAALLHVVSSAAIGFALAFAFYKSYTRKVVHFFVGMAIAIALHALFNFFIIDNTNGTILFVFFFVWLAVIFVFLLFEKVKRISKPLFLTRK